MPETREVGGYVIRLYEVSNGQYQAFLDDAKYFAILATDPPAPPPIWMGERNAARAAAVRWEDLPVVGVSYNSDRNKRLVIGASWRTRHERFASLDAMGTDDGEERTQNFIGFRCAKTVRQSSV